MPGRDGPSYLEEYASKGQLPCPVIMLTGHGHEEVVAKAFKCGIMEYLRKADLEGGRLYRSVLNALETWRLRKAVEKQQKEMEDFVYAAAHDLKSPLSTIAGYITRVAFKRVGVITLKPLSTNVFRIMWSL